MKDYKINFDFGKIEYFDIKEKINSMLKCYIDRLLYVFINPTHFTEKVNLQFYGSFFSYEFICREVGNILKNKGVKCNLNFFEGEEYL